MILGYGSFGFARLEGRGPARARGFFLRFFAFSLRFVAHRSPQMRTCHAGQYATVPAAERAKRKIPKVARSQLCKRDTNYVTSRECVYNCACSPSNILDVGIFENRVLSSSTHGSSSCPISSAALTRAASSPNPQQCLLPEPSGLPIVASSAPSRSLPPPRTSLQRARVAQRCGSSQFFCPFSSAFEACISRSRPPLRNRPP